MERLKNWASRLCFQEPIKKKFLMELNGSLMVENRGQQIN